MPLLRCSAPKTLAMTMIYARIIDKTLAKSLKHLTHA